jgi:hypothetical protein
MPGVRLDVETLKPKQGQYLALPTSTRAFMCRQNVRFAGSAMFPRDRIREEPLGDGIPRKPRGMARGLRSAPDRDGRAPAQIGVGGTPLIYNAVASVLNRNVLAHCNLELCGSAWRAERPVTVCASPKRERDRHGIDVDAVPPCRLITMPVKLAMMEATNRNRE